MPSIYSGDARNHPQIDMTISTGMRILDDQEVRNNAVLEWFVSVRNSLAEHEGDEHTHPRDWRCEMYAREEEFAQEGLGMSNRLWRYFNYDDFLLDQWQYNESNGEPPLFLVFHDKSSDDYVLLEDVGNRYDQWDGKVKEFFKGHPAKHESFYVIEKH